MYRPMVMGNAHTNIESVSSLVVNKCMILSLDLAVHSPLVFNGFYDEPKCWTNCVHVFVHQSLNNSGFTSIVQPSFWGISKSG